MKVKELIKNRNFHKGLLAVVALVVALGIIYFLAQSKASGLVFWDEFNSAPLNTNNWLATTPYASHDDVYAQRYTDNNLSFVNTGQENALRLQTRKETATSGSETWNYTSGTITTGSRVDYGGAVKKAFSYGYFEMRAKLPKGQGIWPAFWLTNDDPDQAKHHEIDAFEVLGHEPNKVYMTYHLSGQQVYQAVYIGPDFSAGYHTFAVDWQPTSIRWYVDGVKRGEYTGRQLPNPLWVTANTTVGTPGSWSGAPDATTVFPQNFDIDYIRSYTTMPTATPPPPADTVAPTVAITAPTNSATISGTVNVTASAQDNVAVSKVEFYLDGTLKNSKNTSPYIYPLDTSGITSGAHTITAKAYDTSNLTGQAQVVVNVTSGSVVIVPTLKITYPSSGTSIGNGRLPITVTVTDQLPITNVRYYLDDKLLGTSSYQPYGYTLQGKKISSGSHVLKAVMTDSQGRTATDQVTINH